MTATSKVKLARKAVTTIAGTGYTAGKFVGKRAGSEIRGGAVVAGAAAGAAGAFFLDPESGKRRRHVARDKALKYVRRGASEAERKADYASGVATGAVKGATPSDRDPARDLNDPALARKVETEIFRDREAPKGSVNVNVEDGVVYLRGEVRSPDEITSLLPATRRVGGVREVENLLHLPGTEPKAKDGAPKAAERP
jgi:osmotically-inducible protein OsmY